MSEMMDMMGSKMWVINFYREQLGKFDRLGLGKLTEHNVKVTPQLIDITSKRLSDLSAAYSKNTTDILMRVRKHRLRKAIRNKENGQLKHDGAATTKSSKDIGSNGHEGSKS